MILAIDVGNTQLVAGCMQNGRSVVSARFETNTRSTAAEYAIKFKIWLEMNNVSASQIEGGIISTVVPPLASVLRETFRMLCGKEPVVVGPGVRTGLNIKIDNPAQLGADIVAGAVASIAKYPLPQIVFDMGTATTACVIDAAGVLRGVVTFTPIAGYVTIDYAYEETPDEPMGVDLRFYDVEGVRLGDGRVAGPDGDGVVRFETTAGASYELIF